MGFGYCSRHLYHKLLETKRFAEYFATSRSIGKSFEGIEFIDITHHKEIPLQYLRKVTHILVSNPPEGSFDYFYEVHKKTFASLPSLEWLGYLSSTSVYGDHQGAWVDETSLCKPKTQEGENRLKIENHYLNLYYNENLPVHIFRLSGIYGPGRSVFEQLQNPEFLCINEPQKLFSRIHVSDVVKSLWASICYPTPGAIYNLADYEPTSLLDVIQYACNLAHCSPPPVVSIDNPQISQRMRQFYRDNKRVDGNKIRKILNFNIDFQNFRVGLEDIYNREHTEHKY